MGSVVMKAGKIDVLETQILLIVTVHAKHLQKAFLRCKIDSVDPNDCQARISFVRQRFDCHLTSRPKSHSSFLCGRRECLQITRLLSPQLLSLRLLPTLVLPQLHSPPNFKFQAILNISRVLAQKLPVSPARHHIRLLLDAAASSSS